MGTRDGAVTGLDPVDDSSVTTGSSTTRSSTDAAPDDPGALADAPGTADEYATDPYAGVDPPWDVDAPAALDERVGPELLTAAADARTVTSAAAAVLAAAAPAPARTWTVSDVTEPPALPTAGTALPRGSRLAVAATALVVIGVLGGLGWLVWSAWEYVTTAPDAAQQAHWEQLRGLVDLVAAVALLVVGTVLGTSLQARWTTSARTLAREHARAATEQHEVALANAEAARRNAAAAITAGSDLARALDLLDRTRPILAALEDLVADRDRDGTHFVTVTSVASANREPHVAGYRVDRAGDIRLAEAADETVDRRLTTLAVQAQVTAGSITDWLVRRR